MDMQIFQRVVDLTKNMQQPMQQLTELNIKTLQSLSYMRPEVLAKIKDPEELFEKQVNIAVENSHKVLDYMRKSFEIMEGSLVGFSRPKSNPLTSAIFKSVVDENPFMQPEVKKAVKKVTKAKKVSKPRKAKAKSLVAKTKVKQAVAQARVARVKSAKIGSRAKVGRGLKKRVAS